MKKNYIIILALSILTNLFAKQVARVENYTITEDEVSAQMVNYEGDWDISFEEIKKIALNDLIKEKLFLVFADRNGVQVSDEEVESYFIRLLGTDPKMQTNGEFDRAKFEELKHTEQVRKILREMRNDILLNKSKQILRNTFKISEQQLLEKYVIENIKIDLNYALLNIDDISVPPDYTVKEAIEYSRKHRILSRRKIKLNFFIVPCSDFEDSVHTFVSSQILEITLFDTTLTTADIDSLKTVLSQEQMVNAAKKQAIRAREDLNNGKKIEYDIMETGFMNIDDKIGQISPFLTEDIFRNQIGIYQDPVKISRGYLVYSLQDIKLPELIDAENEPQKIWRSFLKYKKKEPEFQTLENYFHRNLENFISQAAVVMKIEIPVNDLFFDSQAKLVTPDSIKNRLSTSSGNYRRLRKIIDEFNLKWKNKVIYLDNFRNSEIDEYIASEIRKNNFNGFYRDHTSIIFFRMNTFFPEFIPNLQDVYDQIVIPDMETVSDTAGYREFYREHQKDFISPDSLKLGGVLIPWETDSVLVTNEETKEYYLENLNLFTRNKSVSFDYIFAENAKTIRKASEYISNGIEFDLVKFCFNEKNNLFNNQIYEYNDLPEDLQQTISRIDKISGPLPYENGWLIIKKNADYSAGVIELAEIGEDIESIIEKEKAEKFAYKKAKTVFDSTKYFSQCHKYTDHSYIFETSCQSVFEDFLELGDISEYRKDILRLWLGEKFSRIIKTDNGFAVVFILKKILSKQLTYDESLEKIKHTLSAEQRFEQSGKYAENLRKSIIAGADPDSLLKFFGGFKRIRELTLRSKIPEIEYSRQLLEDISKRKEGYFSPPIRISNDELLFYQLERKNEITAKDFDDHKQEFEENFLKTKFAEWFNNFNKEVDIEIFME